MSEDPPQEAPAHEAPANGSAPTPAGQAAGGAAAGEDLDDLAHRLYPKLRPYLKQELWLDRERSGSLIGLS